MHTQKAVALQLDLTAEGASGTVNGAVFEHISNDDPAGTGVIDSFLRLQSPGNSTTEKGYNTDYRPLEFDENNSPQFTRSLLLGDVPVVNIDGTNYRQFILDINEPNSTRPDPERPNITLDMFQLFLGNAGDLTHYPNFDGNATKIFDLDIGADGDSAVVMKDSNPGSGRYDYLISVPDNLFQGSNEYVYLYSKFTGAEGGFEEFAVRESEPPRDVPEPATLLGMGLIGGIMGLLRRRQVQ